LIEKNIAKKNYKRAKELINEFLNNNPNVNSWNNAQWIHYLLDIAGKEKDIPSTRNFSFVLIKNHFNEENYRIYKSTYGKKEWENEFEKLVSHYGKENRYFSDSLANLFVAEKCIERLMLYIEEHLSLGDLEKYYAQFADEFPEKTLGLFKLAIYDYAEQKVGRSHYEYIAHILKDISKIKGGKTVKSEIVNQLISRYKNRRAMRDVLKGL
jgi:hypothetical protein